MIFCLWIWPAIPPLARARILLKAVGISAVVIFVVDVFVTSEALLVAVTLLLMALNRAVMSFSVVPVMS